MISTRLRELIATEEQPGVLTGLTKALTIAIEEEENERKGRWVGVEEAAIHFNREASTIRRWCQKNSVRHRQAGGKWGTYEIFITPL